MSKRIMFLINKKAQIGAPFELLVAVVVMGFVILAGTYALSNLSESTCLGNKRQDLGELVTALRDVVLGSDLTFRNISLTTKPCFNSRYEKIRLVAYNNQRKCTAYCGGGNNCLLLEYTYEVPGATPGSYKDFKYPIPPICTNLPSYISFANSGEESDCGINSGDHWIIINPIGDNGIPLGRYKIFRTSATGASTSKICFLKRT